MLNHRHHHRHVTHTGSFVSKSVAKASWTFDCMGTYCNTNYTMFDIIIGLLQRDGR